MVLFFVVEEFYSHILLTIIFFTMFLMLDRCSYNRRNIPARKNKGETLTIVT